MLYYINRYCSRFIYEEILQVIICQRNGGLMGNLCMNVGEEILEQIKRLCFSVTEDTYDSTVQQGHELLDRLKDLDMKKEDAYQLLLKYHNSIENGISRDCAADILDFIVGWCSPQMCIWKDG